MSLLEKTAALLDAIADDLDVGAFVSTPVEAPEKIASEVDALAYAYTQVTGESADDETIAALVQNDVVKSTILKIASKTPSEDTLGGPSSRASSSDTPQQPLRGEAAIEAARQKYANRIITLDKNSSDRSY